MTPTALIMAELDDIVASPIVDIVSDDCSCRIGLIESDESGDSCKGDLVCSNDCRCDVCFNDACFDASDNCCLDVSLDNASCWCNVDVKSNACES